MHTHTCTHTRVFSILWVMLEMEKAYINTFLKQLNKLWYCKDQIKLFGASDLGLYCLPKSFKKWVDFKYPFIVIKITLDLKTSGNVLV